MNVSKGGTDCLSFMEYLLYTSRIYSAGEQVTIVYILCYFFLSDKSSVAGVYRYTVYLCRNS